MSTTKLRIRKRLSQLLAGILIAPLFSFVPAVLGPNVLLSTQPANAIADQNVNCTGGGTFTIVNNVVTTSTYTCAGSVVIPSGVTRIDNSAFNRVGRPSDETRITSVTLSNTVTSVGTQAFDNNKGITSLTLGTGLTSIGSNGFNNLYGLTSVVIPPSVTTIDEWAFGNAQALTSLTLNEGLVTLGFAAFWANKVQTLVLPNSLTSLSNGAAFGGNSSMKNLTLGSGLTTIGGRSFDGNSGILSLTIPSGVTTLGQDAFKQFAQSSYTFCGSLSQAVLDNAGLTGKTKLCTQAQTINRTSTSPTSPVKSGTYTPTATATSSLTVAITIASGSSSVCSISAGVVTFNTVGSCVIQYNQSGNATYSAAAQVTESLTIGKATPTFSAWSNVSKTVGDSPFTVTPPTVTGSLQGGFTYTSATTSVISVSGSTLTVAGVGTSVITATFTPTDLTNYNTAQTTMTVTVSPSSVSTLSNLVVSAGTLLPTFVSGTTNYTASVANSVLSTTVTPTKTQANATITVNGTSVTSGSASGAIALNVGSNTITVIVTAQDGTTTGTYTVTVTRAASNDATLSAASIKGQTATLGTPNALLASVVAGSITLTTAQAIGSAITTFTKTDAGATISRIVKYPSGASTSNFESDSIFTDSGSDTVSKNDFFIIKVTAADASVRYYRINVIVNSNVSTLSGMSVKGQTSTLGTPNTALGSETPGAITLTTSQATSAAATTFTMSDASAITKIVKYASGTTADTTNFGAATDLTSGTTTTVSNGDYFIVKVTAADGSTVNYYRINVTVNSDVTTLSAATIKGQTPTLGTPNAVLASVLPGAIALTTAQAVGTDTTTFTKTDSNSTISKIVKYASGASIANFESDSAFANGAASTLTHGDFFIVKVTAADATVRYYRINVTVNSNIATLSVATIKGISATVGTAATALGSLSPGVVTLTSSQGTGDATTTFTKTDAGATVTKIAKLATGTVENLTNFNAAATFTNGSGGTVSDGDFFLIQVTAADQTINYSRVNVAFATNPTEPQTLTVTAQAGGANLTWSAPASNGGSALTGYVIEASTDSVTWTSVGTTNQSTTQFSVTTLLNGTAYAYRVRATNSSGDSTLRYATSTPVVSFYYVVCSISGSFHVNSTASPVVIPSAAGRFCSGEVTIPQGIQQVNINAFTQTPDTVNRFVTKVNFPATGLRTIDQGAFKNLGLTSISIPASVETVGIYSFMNNYLTSISVAGTGVGLHPTALLNSAFAGNGTPGPVLTLGSGKIQIGQNFGTATSFSNVIWGTGLRTIENRAFYNVAGSTWVPLFPATITSFESQAFEGTGIKTIRFGSATTHAVTTIASSAFDPSITSVQYCGQSGTVISNYINSRFTSKTIWCSEEVPNAPINLTAVAGSSGQIVLNWAKGADRNGTNGLEAPTVGFEIRYSSNGGSTWSTLIQAAATATSLTVPNLMNGTTYIFQVRAKNLFGESAYSANASAMALGESINPIFGPSTSTADGFTVNIINYDATFTYGVPAFTVGSGSISVGTAVGTNLLLTVTGMSPGSLATISINNQKQGLSSGTGIASGTALNAAMVPIIGNIVTLTGGFTAAVANYDAAYQWSVSSTLGTAIITTQGGITVSGVAPSTAVELTVNATRVGHASGSTKVTVTTLALLKVFYNATRSTGGAVPTDANSYASNASATVLANPASGGLTLNGYDFAGWSLNSNETGQVYQSGSSLALGLVSITLYAKWTLTQYTVTYFSNGATGGAVPTDSGTYTMGGSVPILGNTGTLVRTGYSFIGWGISSTDTVNQYVSGNSYTMGTNNVAFWARWSPNTYRVTFDANGGSGAASKAFDDYTTAGTAISLATRNTLEKSGYNFVGWGLSAVSTPVADSFITTADVDLYAQWRVANYAITYLAGTYGSGTLPTQGNVEYGTSFTIAPSTGLSGSDGPNLYAFVSWSDGTRTYAPGQSILMGAGAVTLTALWTRIYNVTYSYNGGSVTTPIATQQKIAGDTILISSTVPVRAGYDFISWKDQSGEVAIAGASYEVRENHYLLYAQWTAKPYTITYDVNGGNTSPIQSNRTIGQIFTVAAAPSKIGHDFEYWRDGTNNYNPGADYQVATSDVVLQAIWTPKVYQISYNFNGGTGTPIASQNYTFGTGPANLPASGPSRQDFSFRGWSNSTTATTGEFTYEPSGNILLHAAWVTSVYRLTFNAGIGVSDSATATITIGQSLTLPSATRTNYTLQGWSIDPIGGTVLLTSSPYTPTTDATLYAQWAAQIFTVTYNGNGGTAGKASDSIVYNAQTPIPLPSATRLNYVFNGWYSQATGGYLIGDSGANYLPTGSITAYARWVQGSLSGMGPATLIAQITVRDGIDTGFTAGSNGSTATVAYTAGALPDGTVISAYLENSPVRVTSLLQTPASPVLSLILAWVAPDGTVPDTAPGKPIIMTVMNSSITAGSKIFGLVGNQTELLGIALVNGQVQVSITKDPAVVVAMVSPDSPSGIIATAIDSTSATISWVAPASNGGSAITKYIATAGAGKSCESVTTSCVISGLVAGTPYTFTVLATNAIGDSGASTPSPQLSLTAPASGGSGGVGGGSAPSTPVIQPPAIPAADISAPATDAKAAVEKAAAEAKAAAELKAVQERAAAEKAAAEALRAAQEIADTQAKAAAELKAAQDKAEEELRIATELKAAQEKADAELKAAAEKKALDDAAAAAALAAKKIVPKITLYSISSKLTLSAYDNAYLKKYISTLKSKAPVTCIGYYYTKNTTITKAKALASTQAKAVCSMIKKAKPSVITSIALYPSTKAPLAAKGAKWVAVSYRVDSFNKK